LSSLASTTVASLIVGTLGLEITLDAGNSTPLAAEFHG